MRISELAPAHAEPPPRQNFQMSVRETFAAGESLVFCAVENSEMHLNWRASACVLVLSNAKAPASNSNEEFPSSRGGVKVLMLC